MRSERFGPLDRPVPVVGLGTWQMEKNDRAAAIAAIRRAVDLGATHIDTAELYGSGRVEEMVGVALADGLRDRVFLASKVMPDNAHRDGVPAACARSLRRLRTDHLDLYLLHWRGRHPLEETISAFERLVDEGKIRAWGVSNFDVEDLEEALAVAGPGRMACNQVLYHLQERTIEHAVLPWCERHQVAVVGYSPFGSGRFPSPRSASGRALAEVAARRGVTPYAIALAFLVRRPALFAIPKSASAARVEENSAAGDLALDADELARLEAAFPPGPRGRLPML